ncbi:MAG: glutathione binding-like protein [Alphaproteobacteria bacterium]
MLELYYWTTPNGHKVTMFLEEAELAYSLRPVNIAKGEQFEPEFLAIAPNNRIPALVDPEPDDGGAPLALFESGAILEYLADKTGRFLPRAPRPRFTVLQWLYWQMGGLGPMLGQNHHFKTYAPERIDYAIKRYVDEAKRLYRVLDNRLEGRAFIAGDDYSIADMACYPWTVSHERQGIDLADYPHVRRWFEAIKARPATERAYARAKEINTETTMSDEAKTILFGQTAPARPGS